MIIQPREVKFRTVLEAARRRPTLFGLTIGYLVVSVVVGSIMMVFLPAINNDAPKIDRERISKLGETTAGVITNIETQYNIRVNNEHPSIIFYRYQAKGVEIESKMKILDPDKVSRLSVGDSIAIKYLDGQSMIATIEPFEFQFELFLLIPGAFFIAGLVIAMFVVYFARNEIVLYKYGKVVAAEVLSVKRARVRRRESLILNYRYRGDSGRMHVAEKIISDLLLANNLKFGDTIKIFVSPTDESKSTLIPKLEIARNNWTID